MTKREIRHRAKLAIGQLLFNSNWGALFDATGLPEEARQTFIDEVYDIGWRLQRLAEAQARPALPPIPSEAA